MQGRKTANSSNNKIKDYLKTQIVNSLIYLAVFLFFCVISVGADIKTDHIVYISMCFVSLSSFLVGFISGIKERKNGMYRGIISALPLNLLLIIISLVLTGFKPDICFVFTVVASLLMSAVGGIVSVNIRLK